MKTKSLSIWDVWFQRAATLTLVLVALYMGLQQFMAMEAGADPLGGLTAPENWTDELETGIRIGDPDAPLAIVEFMDLQCPFCADWWARVDSLLADSPDAVQVTFHHFPLQNHPAAMPAAIGAECADRQGRFSEFVAAIFSDQQSLTSRSMSDYAEAAGLPDLETFEMCAAMPADSFPRIAYGLELGRTSGVRSTPTVWINGSAPRPRPSLQELRSLAGGKE